jgi:hypothetical protein
MVTVSELRARTRHPRSSSAGLRRRRATLEAAAFLGGGAGGINPPALGNA